MRSRRRVAADACRRARLAALVSAVLLLASPVWPESVEHNLEALVGRIAARLTAEQYGTLDNPLLTDWVNAVGARVAAPCPRQEFPFRFGILDTAEVNAFSLPGAHIFVTRGLLAHLHSDDELAGVLAHEVGHLADRDFQRIVARQLLFLGLGEGVRRSDEEQLLTPLYIVQVLNTFRHSRRQEDQADLRGVQYALAAHYDPLALTAFFDAILAGRDEPRAWYKAILETHPDAYKRRERTIERTHRLCAADPGTLAAVAADLRDRYEYGAALRTYALMRELAPDDIRAPLGEAEVAALRGQQEASEAACRRALLIAPADPRALALARRAESLAPDRERPAATPTEAPNVDLDREALARLTRLGKGLAADRRFDDALTWAQAYRPEADDWRWVYLVVKAQVLLMATDRLRWRVREVAGLAEGGAAAWADAQVTADATTLERVAHAYNTGVAHGLRAGADLRLAMQLLPTVLGSLALTGNGDPLGRMSSTRFALLEGDLLATESRVKSALKQARAAARDVALAEVDRYACTLDALGATADERQLAIYRGLAATRFRLTADEVRSASADDAGFGAACRAVALRLAGAAPSPEPIDLTYEQAESMRIALRLLTSEAKAETLQAANVTHRAP
jgi:predicted Zn-dependent protease